MSATENFLTEFELINIRPEIGTPKALATIKLFNLPDDTCVIFLHEIQDKKILKKNGSFKIETKRIDQEYGWFFLKDKKIHVGGYIPCMLGYTVIAPGTRVIFPDVSNLILGHQRFLSLIKRYKEKYNLSRLKKLKGKQNG